MRKSKVLLLIVPVVTLILEALPYGAVLNFANPEGEPIGKTFSYFSLVPLGYANFAPFLTAGITCIAFVLLVFYCITEKAVAFKLAKDFFAVGAVLSVCPLGFGFKSFSPVAALISACLIAEIALITAMKNKLAFD